jgi:sulfopyruvate decarboxylase subunit alpha
MANIVVGADLKTARGVAAARGIERLQPDLVAYIPSNVVAPIIAYLQDHPIKLMVIAREEEAVGIVGGAALAGRTGVIVMQDNGFGNALTALATFPVAYHLPLLIVANTRGGLGEYNSMIHTISERSEALLDAGHVRWFQLDGRTPIEDWSATLERGYAFAMTTHRPVFVLVNLMGG